MERRAEQLTACAATCRDEESDQMDQAGQHQEDTSRFILISDALLAPVVIELPVIRRLQLRDQRAGCNAALVPAVLTPQWRVVGGPDRRVADPACRRLHFTFAEDFWRAAIVVVVAAYGVPVLLAGASSS